MIHKGIVVLVLAQCSDPPGGSPYARTLDPEHMLKWWGAGSRNFFVQFRYIKGPGGAPKEGFRNTWGVTNIWRGDDGRVCIERRRKEYWTIQSYEE